LFTNEFYRRLKREDLSKGLHQAVLNIGYSHWQERENSSWSYGDMIKHITSVYGDFAAFLILIGKYNHQVNNGGHIQYFHNGFADGVGGFGCSHDPEHPLHAKLIRLFKKFKLNNLNLGNRVLDILERFQNISVDDEKHYIETCGVCGGSRSCSICNGSGLESEEKQCSDCYQGDGECLDCGGSGEVECDNPEYGQPDTYESSELSEEYWEISESWMKVLEKHVQTVVEQDNSHKY
jgi:hypothetical protein